MFVLKFLILLEIYMSEENKNLPMLDRESDFLILNLDELKWSEGSKN